MQHLFSIMHLNIQSLLPKIDLVRSEALAYDIMIFTESWLKPNVSNTSILIENFHEPQRKDRPVKIGGGVTVYVAIHLTSNVETISKF